MNFGSKVALVLLILAVVLCPLAACAAPANTNAHAAHPCCPSEKTHAPTQQASDCKCIASQPPSPSVVFDAGSLILAEVPEMVSAVDTAARLDPGVAVQTPASEQDSFLDFHQFRI